MKTTVVHVYDPDHKVDGFMLMNMIHTRSGEVVLHVDRGPRHIDVVRVGPDGAMREVEVASECGCP